MARMKTLCTLFAVALLAAGCTSTKVSQSLASGAIGCPPKDIQIRNETRTRGIQTFEAVCKGQRHACTYNHPNLSCKPIEA